MKNVFILTLAIFISGCTSTETVKSNSHQMAQNKGQILTESASFLAHLSLLAQNITLKIKSIDGVEFKHDFMNDYPSEIEASSGEHKLTLTCHGYIDGSAFNDKDDVVVSITVKAGHQYMLKPNLISYGQCGADIEDITNKQS